MSKLRKAPIVNLVTNKLIKDLVGEYSLETQDLIWAIADNEQELLKGCETSSEYKAGISEFISDYKTEEVYSFVGL